VLFESALALRHRLIDEIVGSDGRMIPECGGEITPEHRRLLPVTLVTPQTVVELVVVLLFRARARQRQWRDDHFDAGSLRPIENRPEDRKVPGDQALIVVETPEEKFPPGFGRNPSAERQPHPRGAVAAQRPKVFCVGRGVLEAIGAALRRVPEIDRVGSERRSGQGEGGKQHGDDAAHGREV
jgi:hypothetical protein